LFDFDPDTVTNQPVYSLSPDGNAVDSPYEWLDDPYVHYDRHDAFAMYLMWEHTWTPASPRRSIPVPLKVVNWYWGFTADRVADNDDGNDWDVTAEPTSTNPPAVDTTDYPEWDGRVKDVPWIEDL
jgi:hypothetical protein